MKAHRLRNGIPRESDGDLLHIYDLPCAGTSKEIAAMIHAYYNADTLERTLLWLERTYDMPSAEFYASHTSGEPIVRIPRFHQSFWASVYRDFLRLRGGDLAHTAELVLAS